MNKRVFVLTVEVLTSGDDKIDGNLKILKDSLDEILTAKKDLDKYFGYNSVNVVSIKEIWITEDFTDKEVDD